MSGNPETEPTFRDLAQRYLDTVVAITSVTRDNGKTLARLEAAVASHEQHSDNRLDLVVDEIKGLRIALEVRNALIDNLLGWLDRRWVTLLLGVALGLGVSGAGAILRALFAQGLSIPN